MNEQEERRFDELSEQIAEIELEAQAIEMEIVVKWKDHRAAFDRVLELKKEKCRLLGWTTP